MKLLIVLSRDEYVRNYGETSAFRALQGEHECFVVAADHCKQVGALRAMPGFRGIIGTNKRTDKKHFDLFNVLTWRERRKSRTFYYRFSRYYKTYPNDGVRNALRNLQGLRQAARFVLLGNRYVSRLSVPRMIRRLGVNADLERFLREIRPDLVLLPCSAYDPIGNDLARLAPSLGFKTLFLVDNWDNLSSKSIFWAKPDFLGVWGEQSKDHAERIHDIGRERVFLLGTPRFEHYYAVDKASPGTKAYPFPYILFCGSALAFDELSALRVLDDELSRRPDLYAGIKVVYRPHPQRQPRLCPDVFRPEDYRNVVLDEQLKDAYRRDDRRFQPSLDYYPALLAGAKLIVCPLTTMLVEGLICGTPVLALTYDDGVHYTSPHNAYKYYLHFEGIEGLKGLHLNRDRNQLGAELRALIAAPPAVSRQDIHASLQPFIYRDELSYADRLARTVRDIAVRIGH